MTEKKDDGYTTCPVCHGSGKNNGGSGQRQNACQVPEGPEHTGVCD